MAAVRVLGEVRSLRQGKAILQPIVVCGRIVVVKAPQKRVGERDRGGGMCVGCEALEGAGVLGTEHAVCRGHVCVGLPSSAEALLCFFSRGFVSAAGPKGQQEGQGVEGAKADHSDDHALRLGISDR
jgi:hypothetical protein